MTCKITSLLHGACCAALVTCCMLHSACCMLHSACCMLHSACCMLHSACCVVYNVGGRTCNRYTSCSPTAWPFETSSSPAAGLQSRGCLRASVRGKLTAAQRSLLSSGCYTTDCPRINHPVSERHHDCAHRTAGLLVVHSVCGASVPGWKVRVGSRSAAVMCCSRRCTYLKQTPYCTVSSARAATAAQRSTGCNTVRQTDAVASVAKSTLTSLGAATEAAAAAVAVRQCIGIVGVVASEPRVLERRPRLEPLL
jgi:hypothetical protein